MSSEMEKSITAVAESIVADLGLTLVDVEYRGGKKPAVQVIIYRDSGVKVDDCEAFSRALGERLDEEDFIAHTYTLEVSSPGLERRLRQLHEYDLFKGRNIRIICHGLVHGHGVWQGELVGLQSDCVCVQGKDDKIVRIPLASVKRAQLVYSG